MGPGALLLSVFFFPLSVLVLSASVFLFLVWFSCPRVVERESSYPPLAECPSLPTPSRIGRMASRQEGGGGTLFLALGWSSLTPFSRQGLAVCCFVFSWLCVFCELIAYVRCWRLLCLSLLFCSFLSLCARPWVFRRELKGVSQRGEKVFSF